MCHPNPGPRCSNHALKEYVAALQNFENCDVPSKKISLGKILHVKQLQLDATPKGQNRLTQQLNQEVDAGEKLLLQARLTVGADTRKRQLADWNNYVHSKENPNSNALLLGELKTAGLSNKYEIATGLSFNFLSSYFKECEVVETSGIQVGSAEESHLLLTLPPKYQAGFGTVVLEEGTWKFKASPMAILSSRTATMPEDEGNEKAVEAETVVLTEGLPDESSISNPMTADKQAALEKVLNENVDYTDLSSEEQSIVFDWFAEQLEEQGYKAAVSVNSRLLSTSVITVKELSKQYKISLKLRKRLGGTTFFNGDADSLHDQLAGSPFEHGEIEQLTFGKQKITIVNGLPQFPKKDCFISDSLFLSWNEQGYYQARQRHIPKDYDLFVALERVKELPTGFSDEAKSLLKPHPIQQEETPENTV
jgi:hypothetical protein